MTSSKKELQSKLAKTEKLILTLEWAAVLLLCFYSIQILHQVFAPSSASVFDTLGRVGILISVLLASQVARRQLTFAQIVEKQKQHDNITRIKHHLMMMLLDLRTKIDFLKNSLNEGERPTSLILAVNKEVREISSELYERDIYEILPVDVFSKISLVKGSIFALNEAVEFMVNTLTQKNIFTMPAQKERNDEFFDKTIDLLTEIDKEISDLRMTCE